MPRIAVFHRGDIEVHRLQIADREKWECRQLLDVHRLEVATAAAADFDATIFPLFIGRGGDERLSVFCAVDAGVGRQLPCRRTERATERPMAADNLGHCRPRTAGRAVAMIPMVECSGDRISEERLQQSVGKRTYGELSNEPDQVWRKTAMSRPRSNGIL